MELNHKQVLVIGAKRSGLGASQLLREKGANVRVMDQQPLSSEEQAKFDALGIPVVPESVVNVRMADRDPDLIVLSPGVPFDAPFLIPARKRGVSVIGEVELASYFCADPSSVSPAQTVRQPPPRSPGIC